MVHADLLYHLICVVQRIAIIISVMVEVFIIAIKTMVMSCVSPSEFGINFVIYCSWTKFINRMSFHLIKRYKNIKIDENKNHVEKACVFKNINFYSLTNCLAYGD